MRIVLLFLGLASTAQAWEFTPGLPCLLSHETDNAAVELTYDPTLPLYSITIQRDQPWPHDEVFSMRFEGPSGLSISTDRQTLSADKHSLTVTDRGFGNVLDGLQYNERAFAVLGETSVALALAGAFDPVAAFRLCKVEPGV